MVEGDRGQGSRETPVSPGAPRPAPRRWLAPLLLSAAILGGAALALAIALGSRMPPPAPDAPSTSMEPPAVAKPATVGPPAVAKPATVGPAPVAKPATVGPQVVAPPGGVPPAAAAPGEAGPRAP
jgi:hypothetical protein